MAEAERFRIHATVSGRVQGVGFRFFVRQEAEEIGLTGWVRNRWDESVEVVAEGERPDLEKLLATLKRGPRSAYVSEVKTDWLPATGEFKSFTVRSTD